MTPTQLHLTLDLLLICALALVNANVFTAVVKLQKLYELEASFVSGLKEYASRQRSSGTRLPILQDVERFLSSRIEPNMTFLDKSYVENPINAFRLVRRIHKDREELRKICQNTGINYRCRDEHENCLNWAAVGECVQNPNFMLVKCKRSCNICQLYYLECTENKYLACLRKRERYIKLFPDVTLKTSVEAETMQSSSSVLQIKRLENVWAERCIKFFCRCTRIDLHVCRLKNSTEVNHFWADVTDDDVSGAAKALVRLWRTYNLNTDDVIGGKILNEISSPLTVEEVYDIVKEAGDQGLYYSQIIWIEALHRRIKNLNKQTAGNKMELNIYRMLAWAYSKMYMPWKAVELVRNFNTEDKGFIRDIEYFKEKANEIPETKRLYALNVDVPEKQHYEALCRGEGIRDYIKTVNTIFVFIYFVQNPSSLKKFVFVAMTSGANTLVGTLTFDGQVCGKGNPLIRLIFYPMHVTSRLKCYLRATSIPFYKAKEEVLNFDPRLSIFHDVIHEAERKEIRESVYNSLQRSRVVGSNNGEQDRMADTRVSETAWLADQNSPLVHKLSKRVEIQTGLSTSQLEYLYHAEEMQVLNYGIGGMYEPHKDFLDCSLSENKFREGDPVNLKGSGDRIATWLYYLNGVKAGGATVFTKLNVTVPVVEGAAAFWFNLKRNGVGEELTEHAGCPVLLGSKWVSNKWIRETGQVFRRLCGMKIDALDEPFD